MSEAFKKSWERDHFHLTKLLKLIYKLRKKFDAHFNFLSFDQY